MSKGALGRAALVSASGVARWMKPPQQSTAASTLLLLQAKSSVWRPPEQKPIAPTLPVALEAELKKRAQAAGKDVTTKIYKNAGHAFLADYRPSYREAAAQELWGDVQSFFGKHLK